MALEVSSMTDETTVSTTPPSKPPIRKWGWIVIVLLLLACFEFLNFTGFCYSQGRYLSDQELVEIAIKRNVPSLSGTRESTGNNMYTSLEDFYRQNPDCCELAKWGHHFTNNIAVRFFGFYVAVAEIWYRVSSGEKYNYYDSYVLMNACGKIVGTKGIQKESPPPSRPPN
jgi:hypothetical protein